MVEHGTRRDAAIGSHGSLHKLRVFLKRTIFLWSDAVRLGLGPKIQGTVIYRLLQKPSRFLRKYTDEWRIEARDSVFRRKKELFMCSLLPTEILDLLLELFSPKTVLDVGCGTG